MVVAFTGAGISATAGIPTYRGTNGLDTKQELKHSVTNEDSVEENEETPYTQLVPTLTHGALAKLEQMKWLSHIASQNCDNLHRKAGTSPECLSELHGNIFIEYCSKCKTEYERDYEVDAYSTDCHKEPYYKKCRHCGFGHYTGRYCAVPGCRGKLRDTIVNFGDPLFDTTLGGLSKASGRFLAADICLALGSSLSVSPANALIDLPHFLVVVNLQPTDADDQADIRVWAETDQFFTYLMNELAKGPPLSTSSHFTAILQKKQRATGGDATTLSWQELKECIEHSREQESLEMAQDWIAERGQRKRKSR